LIFPFQPTFFGLSEEYQEFVYEQFFFLKHYGGWSFIEAYNLPLQLRDWWCERITKEFEREREEAEKHSNKKRSTHFG